MPEPTDNQIQRTVRLPKNLWEILDEDAKQCRRSSVRQLEVILLAYYGLLENFEVNVQAAKTAHGMHHHLERKTA